MPVLLDPNGELADPFDTLGVPTTFFVTRSGRIRQRTVGYDATRLDEAVGALLAAE